jgi:hypothetical protein
VPFRAAEKPPFFLEAGAEPPAFIRRISPITMICNLFIVKSYIREVRQDPGSPWLVWKHGFYSGNGFIL